MIPIIYNSQKQRSYDFAKIAEKVLLEASEKYGMVSSFPFKLKDRRFLKKSKAIIAIGGDGTILNILSLKESRDIPILPINSGTLGFISSVKSNQLEGILKDYLNYLKTGQREKFKIEKRPFLLVQAEGKEYHAFNDAVISKGSYGKLIDIEASFNGTKTVSFRADGLIIATATGSTAYNLASEGPILHPSIAAMIFNPICPHSLTMRPVVIPGEDTIEVKVGHQGQDKPIYLNIDGLKQLKIKRERPLRFNLEKKSIQFIKPIKEHYYSVLKEKMHWGI